MSSAKLSTPRMSRAIAIFVATSLVYTTGATSFNDAIRSAGDAVGQLRSIARKPFTDRPLRVSLGKSPRRDELRSHWWTPRLARDLERVNFSRELHRITKNGEILASLDATDLLPLFM